MILEEEFLLSRESGAWVRVWYGSKSSGVNVAPATLGSHELGVICIPIDLYKGGDFSSFFFVRD